MDRHMENGVSMSSLKDLLIC